jgi:hypothetical protein
MPKVTSSQDYSLRQVVHGIIRGKPRGEIVLELEEKRNYCSHRDAWIIIHSICDVYEEVEGVSPDVLLATLVVALSEVPR